MGVVLLAVTVYKRMAGQRSLYPAINLLVTAVVFTPMGVVVF